MLIYCLKRILSTIPVMIVVALCVFSLLYLAPGDPATVLAGEQASSAEIEQVRIALGLDQPFPLRFVEWSKQVLSGNLGVSIFSGIPVLELIRQRLEPTIALMITSTIISVLVAVPMGILAARHHNRLLDRIVNVVTALGFSVPVFVIGYVLAWIFAVHLRWLPVQGYSPISEGFADFLRGIIMPAIVVAFSYFSLITRVTRSAMLDVMRQDYVRTARAKGISERSVLFDHALRNASMPIVTVVGLGVALLISGSLITETVFAIPGIGRLTADAILRRDYPIIQGVVLLFSLLYVLVNLLIDLLYTLLDPRVNFQ
ncbi:ABC transporter permease [Paracoccus onubensis]|uniref:ABC transporter permease n=1 Tax=Paracoccus onubensis TaxID=1675788 RepID=UPI0027304BC7|nr:ABC transporter permease [Paracoccus onubensis]MDP0930064.1 ABC transporter permease [Paracoccus onubensis]